MSSTPPRVSGSPEDQAYRAWLQQTILELQEGGQARDVRVRAAELSATNAGNLASNTASGLVETDKRVIAPDAENRIARPILDKEYWEGVIAGRNFVWEYASTSNPGVINRSTVRNVTWNATGSFLFQPNGSIEAAEIDITPILPTPQSGKLYVEAEYTPGSPITPQIWIVWRDAAGDPYAVDHVTAAPTLALSKTVVNVAKVGGFQVAKYSVMLVRPAGLGLGATTNPKVFEVIGTNGLAVSPGGISVEDGSGVKTVEINPSLPVITAPTAPILTSSVGSVSVRWNGNLVAGAAPAHLAYVFAEESANGTTGWTRVGQPLRSAGDIITRPPVGSTRYYRFTPVDTSNRAGTASASASIVVAGVDIPDLSGNVGDILDTVDGLNKIFYQVATVVPTAHANGDLWFIVDPATSIVTEVRIWNGSTWNPYRFVADSVIVPGSVGTITLADGVVTAPKIGAKEVNAEHIRAGSISVDELTPNIGANLDITINPAVTDLQEGLENQQRYFRFGANGLEIGDPAENESLRLDAGRIEMVQAGNVPTYWEAQTFYVERMIVKAANIGAHRFEGYADGRTVIRPLRKI